MLCSELAPRHRLVSLKWHLFFGLLFVGFLHQPALCVAAQKETFKFFDWPFKSTENLDRNGAGAGPGAPEGAALQQKLPPHVSKFLIELEPAEARALLGAFRKGYTIVKRLDGGFILAKPSAQLLDSSAQSYIDADVMMSFQTPQINQNRNPYSSVIIQGRFECKSARLELLYQQFQAGTFGTGTSLLARESTKSDHFRSTSKSLGGFMTSVYCPK